MLKFDKELEYYCIFVKTRDFVYEIFLSNNNIDSTNNACRETTSKKSE